MIPFSSHKHLIVATGDGYPEHQRTYPLRLICRAEVGMTHRTGGREVADDQSAHRLSKIDCYPYSAFTGVVSANSCPMPRTGLPAFEWQKEILQSQPLRAVPVIVEQTLHRFAQAGMVENQRSPGGLSDYRIEQSDKTVRAVEQRQLHRQR